MRFDSTLIAGRLIRRYKRFLSDVVLDDGTRVTAHVANPGSMLGLREEGARVWLSRSDKPGRKLPYSWEIVEADGALVGVNASRPNALAAEALDRDVIDELAGYGERRREVRYGNGSRVDLLLAQEGRRPCYVEIKNVHLMRTPGLAEFPDSVTARGARHLRELTAMVEAGARAVMLYIVQRGDCDHFSVAADIDPTYAQALEEAMARGVEAYCYACRVTPQGIDVERPLTLEPQVAPASAPRPQTSDPAANVDSQRLRAEPIHDTTARVTNRDEQ